MNLILKSKIIFFSIIFLEISIRSMGLDGYDLGKYKNRKKFSFLITQKDINKELTKDQFFDELLLKNNFNKIIELLSNETDKVFKFTWLYKRATEGHTLFMLELSKLWAISTNNINETLKWYYAGLLRVGQDVNCFEGIEFRKLKEILKTTYGANFNFKDIQDFDTLKINAINNAIEILNTIERYPSPNWINFFQIDSFVFNSKLEPEDSWIEIRKNYLVDLKKSLETTNIPKKEKTKNNNFSPENILDNYNIKNNQELADAINFNKTEILEKYISNCLNIDIMNENGITLLMASTKIERLENLKLLLVSGADVKLRDNNNWTALHWAIYNKNVEAVKLLLKYNSPIDKSNSETNDISLAVQKSSLEIVKLLFEYKKEII